MSNTRREIIAASAYALSARSYASTDSLAQLDGAEIARRHQIVRELPTPNFFEGMLLGNGDVGVCVTVRPDALGLHLGKSDSWDIRVSEEHDSQVLSFADLLKLWERASAEAKRQGQPEMLYLERKISFFREYSDKVTASYSKSWPRPWPCGTVWVHWDAVRIQVVRQILDTSNGHYRLELGSPQGPVSLSVFVNTTIGHVCVWSDAPAELLSVAYYPNLDAEAQ